MLSCQTHDQKTALAGQIARACAVFCVDEIIVFNDGQSQKNPRRAGGRDYSAEDERTGYTGFSDPDDFLFHVLSYLETPPHLRRLLFPLHPNLRTAGALPSLDMPHHMKANEWCRYREGVTCGQSDQGRSTLVECGLPSRVEVPATVIEPDTRVTLDLGTDDAPADLGIDTHKTRSAKAISPDAPREKGGYYWGYACRKADDLSSVFTDCPFQGGYDACLGTSERGQSVQHLVDDPRLSENKWQHMLLVFGGVAGLEAALLADTELASKGVTDVKDLFDLWVNLVPGQGSRTIRTEEAVWLGLMGIRPFVANRD